MGTTNAQLIDTLTRTISALQLQQTSDGCVAGCPHKRSSDAPHSLRCASVTASIKDCQAAVIGLNQDDWHR